MIDDLLCKRRKVPHSTKLCLERIEELETEARELQTKLAAAKNPKDFDGDHVDEVCEQLVSWKHELQLSKLYTAAVLVNAQQRQPERLIPLFEK